MASKQLYAVVGRPVLHSKSPFIYNRLFHTDRIDAVYTRLAAQEISEAIDLLRQPGFFGLNITAPFKSDLVPFLDDISDDAKVTGSVNTVVNRNGKLTGFNTDIFGVIRPLLQRKIELSDVEAIVLGAGGAGRSAAYALRQKGAHVTIVNRTVEKGEKAARTIGCRFAPMEQIKTLFPTAKIIVSTLPDDVDIFAEDWLNPDQIIVSASYQSEILKKKAKRCGAKFIGGEEWLIHQAMPAYHYFTGFSADADSLTDVLHASLLSSRNVALIGFMAVGKNAVGQVLARLLGWSFIDTDSIIEEMTGKSISRIFSEQGEAAFRKMERQTIKKFKDYDRTVIACGGGVILDPGNRQELAANCLNVWLYVPLRTALERTKDGSRPLLQTDDTFAQAEHIFGQRRDLYAETADLIVTNYTRSAEETAKLIYDEINQTFSY